MRKSFTLIEILIATAITAVLFALLALVNGSASQTWQTVNERSSQVQDLISVRQSLGKIVKNAVPYFHDNDDNYYNAFRGDSSSFRLASIQRINNLKDGGMIFPELLVEDEKLKLKYQCRPWDENSASDLKESILLEDIASLTCSYAFAEEEREISWTDSWVDEDHDALPLGIQITVTFLNQDQEHFLWRTAGNGRYERWENLGSMIREVAPTEGGDRL